jgi:arylsulfatase A-like enzyme
VFVLTDDLSLNLLRFMPHVQAMERRGMTFRNYFVSDSLCCPSRSSIFTGNLPHDTHVFSNFGADGGFATFYRRGEERHTFAVALQRAGYLTAMMGKYLNGYLSNVGHAADGATSGAPATYVPPGWNEWDVAGWGYPEFDYTLNQDGSLRHAGHQPKDYLTDVLSRLGVSFINRATARGKPFFLETATFAPHGPYVPAPRDAGDFPGLRAPRPASFNRLPTHAPHWLVSRRPLDRGEIGTIDRAFRRRAQSVEAVDRLIGQIEHTLAADHVAQNTYLIFSSDNGFHTGEYRLLPGKLTAFDTDIHVPLVVVGPHVPAGASTGAMTENIDLAKTFAAIGGTTMSDDGHSLLGLLSGRPAPDWRNAVLVEHHGPDMRGGDPDFQRTGAGNPRTYEAMRTPNFLYVEYDDGEREYYDLRSDPFELHNVARALSALTRTQLHRQLHRLVVCHGAKQCWRAMHT